MKIVECDDQHGVFMFADDDVTKEVLFVQGLEGEAVALVVGHDDASEPWTDEERLRRLRELTE